MLNVSPLIDDSAPHYFADAISSVFAGAIYPAGTRTCTVRCGVATGPWTTVARKPFTLTPASVTPNLTHSARYRTGVTLTTDDKPSEIYKDAQGKTHVSYFLGTTKLPQNVARRIVAVDVKGPAYPAMLLSIKFRSIRMNRPWPTTALPSARTECFAAVRFIGGSRPGTTITLSNIKVGTAMQPADFAFVPPSGATPSTLPADAPLLAAGTDAPNFFLPNGAGYQVHLSDFKGKPVVLIFWSTWWSSGPDALAQAASLARRYSPQGVKVLAIHVWNTLDKLRERLGQHPEYAGLTFLADTHQKGQDVGSHFYQVTDVPTAYVIGKDGKITAAMHGAAVSATALEKAIKATVGP